MVKQSKLSIQSGAKNNDLSVGFKITETAKVVIELTILISIQMQILTHKCKLDLLVSELLITPLHHPQLTYQMQINLHIQETPLNLDKTEDSFLLV
jgi:hypothetical protein